MRPRIPPATERGIRVRPDLAGACHLGGRIQRERRGHEPRGRAPLPRDQPPVREQQEYEGQPRSRNRGPGPVREPRGRPGRWQRSRSRDQSAPPVPVAEKPRPTTRPVARKIQPTLFPGRLDVNMNPTTGTAMNVASSNTSEKSQRLRVPMCRSTYDSAIPPTSSTTDTAATQPVVQRRIRIVIRAPWREPRRWPAASATYARTLPWPCLTSCADYAPRPPKARLKTVRYRIVTATAWVRGRIGINRQRQLRRPCAYVGRSRFRGGPAENAGHRGAREGMAADRG